MNENIYNIEIEQFLRIGLIARSSLIVQCLRSKAWAIRNAKPTTC